VRGRTSRTPENEAALLEAVVLNGGNVTAACKECSIGRTTVFDWSQADPEFKKHLAAAVDRGIDVLEDECRRRAFAGTDEPVFHKGEVCGYIRKYSDLLAIFMLKGARPEKYRERFNQEISGPGGGPIRVDNPVVVLPDDGSDPNIPIALDTGSIGNGGAVPPSVDPAVEVPGEPR